MTNIIISIKNLYKIFGDNPKNTNGCSWENKRNSINSTAQTWDTPGVDVLSVSQSTFTINDGDSPDVNVDVTNMVNM